MSVALNVVIILGIVIAGGFLLFFLGDFLLSIIDVKKENASTRVNVQPAVEEKKEKVLNKGFVQAYNPNAEEENTEINEVEEIAEQPQEELVEEVQEDEEEKRIAEARAALEKRKQEILRRMQAQLQEEEEEELEDEEDEETVEEEVIEEASEEDVVEEETAEEDEVQEIEEEVEEQEEVVEDAEVESGVLNTEEELVEENEVVPAVDTDALQAEIEKLKNELGLQKEKNEMLEKELSERSEVEIQTVTLGSKEDYERELAEKQAKLKTIEKEFKQVKKDFIPLFRVHKNLEKDEKKLHRREAIVAKQKVVLYGVNNYADIDEEKAKKLAEDLDLLDGLKLSVNHCKEVVEQNKDRYPILEKLYNTLKSQVDGLKLEIEDLEKTIESFDNEEATTEE